MRETRDLLTAVYQVERPGEKVSRPKVPCWRAENEPVTDGGNPPRPIRHFRMAERRTQDHYVESSPRSFGIGSKIGCHHHQRRRPAYREDARQKLVDVQVLNDEKLALYLPPTFVSGRIFTQLLRSTLRPIAGSRQDRAIFLIC